MGGHTRPTGTLPNCARVCVCRYLRCRICRGHFLKAWGWGLSFRTNSVPSRKRKGKPYIARPTPLSTHKGPCLRRLSAGQAVDVVYTPRAHRMSDSAVVGARPAPLSHGGRLRDVSRTFPGCFRDVCGRSPPSLHMRAQLVEESPVDCSSACATCSGMPCESHSCCSWS